MSSPKCTCKADRDFRERLSELVKELEASQGKPLPFPPLRRAPISCNVCRDNMDDDSHAGSESDENEIINDRENNPGFPNSRMSAFNQEMVEDIQVLAWVIRIDKESELRQAEIDRIEQQTQEIEYRMDLASEAHNHRLRQQERTEELRRREIIRRMEIRDTRHQIMVRESNARIAAMRRAWRQQANPQRARPNRRSPRSLTYAV